MANDAREAVKKHFTELGAQWQRMYDDASPMGHAVNARLRCCGEMLGDPSGKRILDLGCGTGALLSVVGAGFLAYEGIDIAPTMVAATRARAEALGLGSRVTVSEHSADVLPFPSDSFDVVVGLGLLGFVEEPRRVIRESLRVVRADGRLVLSTERRRPIESVMLAITRPARALVRSVAARRPPPRAVARTDHGFIRLLEDAGCTVIDARWYDKRPLPYPFTRLWPRLAYRAAQMVEHDARFDFCAAGYIAACSKRRS